MFSTVSEFMRFIYEKNEGADLKWPTPSGGLSN
jgi:hypothetical protein